MPIAVTMGDPAGVGPEIILKAFAGKELTGTFAVIGDADILRYCAEKLNIEVAVNSVRSPEEAKANALNVLDMKLLNRGELKIGEVTEKSGNAAYQYIVKAARLALEGRVSSIVTLPVNKEAVRLSHEGFTGHTELLAEMCGESRYTMMLTSPSLTVTHVNTHVSMLDAVRNVTKESVLKVIRLTHSALKKYMENPRIAVAGLNAHAGENGSFGEEDLREIIPAVKAAAEEGINADGPIPPDTVFLKAVKGQYDAVVCMYHDQGHIPMKLLDFDGGVNVTLGLPVIRASVDHGTAFDIAYRGVANTKSFVEAYKYVSKLLNK